MAIQLEAHGKNRAVLYLIILRSGPLLLSLPAECILTPNGPFNRNDKGLPYLGSSSPPRCAVLTVLADLQAMPWIREPRILEGKDPQDRAVQKSAEIDGGRGAGPGPVDRRQHEPGASGRIREGQGGARVRRIVAWQDHDHPRQPRPIHSGSRPLPYLREEHVAVAPSRFFTSRRLPNSQGTGTDYRDRPGHHGLERPPQGRGKGIAGPDGPAFHCP